MLKVLIKKSIEDFVSPKPVKKEMKEMTIELR
jgi:hypothetical protein